MKKPVTLSYVYTACLLFLLFTGAHAQFNTPLPAPGEAPALSPVARHGWLRQTGSNLRGSVSGTANVQLKGMSLFWGNSPSGRAFYNEETIAWLAHDWQIDLVRAAVAIANEPRGGGNVGYCDGGATGQMAQLRAVTEAAIKRGVYVIVDWHTHVADQQQYATCVEEFFKEVVRLYGKYPNIIYEIYNEPCNGNGCGSNNWNDIRNYSNRVINVIRQAETANGVTNRNLIIVGTPNFSSQPDVETSQNVTDAGNNVAYALHFYSGDNWHNGNFPSRARNAANAGRLVFVSEFGTVNSNGNTPINTGEADRIWFPLMDELGLSWAYWSVNNAPEAASILRSDASGVNRGGWTMSQLTQTGQHIRGKFPPSSNTANRTFAVTLTQPSTGGTIRQTPVGNQFNYGVNVGFRALPNDRWEFVRWTRDAIGFEDSIAGPILGLPISVSAEFFHGGIIKNGHFTANSNNWTRNGADIEVINNELRVTPTATGTAFNAARVIQSISIEKGWEYELTYWARGMSARTITPRIANSTNTRIYMDTVSVPLTTTMQQFQRKFVSDTTLANAQLTFNSGFGQNTVWFLDSVSLMPVNFVSVVTPGIPAVGLATWSVVRTGGGFQLRGPADGIATASLYDVRGRIVRSMQVRDGLMLSGANIPSGHYLLVVRNGINAEVLRTKVVMAL